MVTLLRYNQDTWFNKEPTVSVALFDFLTKYFFFFNNLWSFSNLEKLNVIKS